MADRSDYVILLARTYIDFMRGVAPNWRKAFFRFVRGDGLVGSSGSFLLDGEGEATLIDPFIHPTIFDAMNVTAERLLNALGEERAVLVLTIDAKFEYDIQFDYNSLERWSITKLDGGDGTPQGLALKPSMAD